MFRALILAIGLSGAAVLAAEAPDNEPRPPVRRRAQLTEEQKALMKEIREKYDKDKDGVLSPEERKSISEEDKARLERAGISQTVPRPRRRPEQTK